MDKRLLSTGVSFLFLVVLCSSPSGPEKSFTIDNIGWYYQNNPADYISAKSFTLSIEISIEYSGADIEASDIEYAKMKYGDISWNIETSGTNFNKNERCISCNSDNYYSKTFSSNGSVMPLGPFEFIVQLNGGNTATKQLTFPVPGKSTTDGFKFVYNENYTGQILSTYTRMIKHPSVLTAIKSGDTIITTFSINDSLVYGGWIWFYSSTDTYLGRSDYFRNFETKAFSAIINGGGTLLNNGQTNTVTLTPSGCVMSGDYSYSDINYLRVVCCDGYQYRTSSSKYDYRSISAKKDILGR